MFIPSQSKTTIRPNTFTAQDAGIYSNAKLDQFWNRILFSKHSETTLQLLGKAVSCSLFFPLTHLIMMPIPHMTIHTIHFVLDSMID